MIAIPVNAYILGFWKLDSIGVCFLWKERPEATSYHKTTIIGFEVEHLPDALPCMGEAMETMMLSMTGGIAVKGNVPKMLLVMQQHGIEPTEMKGHQG